MTKDSKHNKDKKKGPDAQSEHESLWNKFKQTVIPKKDSKEFEGLSLQKKVEIDIRNPDLKAPKDNRFSEQQSMADPGFLEFKSKKKLSKKLEIDARLDLHGLTQDQAYMRLEKFLHTCFQTKKQNTLIITGKGLQIKKGDEDSEKGVLRRQLPKWLESSELRGYIHHYTNNHPFEGGTGAYYVRLRRDKTKR